MNLTHRRPPHVTDAPPNPSLASAKSHDVGAPAARAVSSARTTPAAADSAAATPVAFDFEVAYADAYPRFTGMARQLTPDREAVQDLLQDASLIMFRKRAQFTPGTDFGAWGCTILRNLFYDDYRRRQRRARVIELNPGSLAWSQDRPVAAAAEARLAAADLDALLDALTQPQRHAFLRFRDGYPIAEIAADADEPAGTIKSRLFYARKALVRAYQDRYAEA